MNANTETTRPDLLTADEAADALRLRPSSLHNMARRAVLPSFQIGHRRLFAPEDIAALVASRRRAGGSLQDGRLPPLTGKNAGRTRKPAE